jgi:hypothetical protein
MRGPPEPSTVPFPMFLCVVDGVVYDLRRVGWYGLPEGMEKVHCPACGHPMEVEPKQGPAQLFLCYQCGTTYDRGRSKWYGVSYHHAPSG